MPYRIFSIVDGSTFVVSNGRGDLDAAPDRLHGFFADDTRFLSRWRLTLDGEELDTLSQRLPHFRFVPALSDPSPDESWDGETGLITDVVDRLEGDLSAFEGYLCGPPPMIDASIPMLGAHGLPEAKIFFDKFTITASEEEQYHAAR